MRKSISAIIAVVLSLATTLTVMSFSSVNAVAAEFSNDDQVLLHNLLEQQGYSNEEIEKAFSSHFECEKIQNRAGTPLYYSVFANGATFSSAYSVLNYDMSSTSYIGFTSGAAAVSNGITVSTTGPTYNTLTYMQISQTYSASSVVTVTGSLCNFKFRSTNISGAFIPSTSNPSISFMRIYPGDVDQNNTIDMYDLLMLAQYVAGIPTSITQAGEVAADCNGDGVVDSVDQTLLTRVIAGEPTSIFW